MTQETGVYSTVAAGSTWWIVDAAIRYGPSWHLIPPLLLGSASLIGALRSWLDGRQARRHAEERHRATLAQLTRSLRAEVERLP